MVCGWVTIHSIPKFFSVYLKAREAVDPDCHLLMARKSDNQSNHRVLYYPVSSE